MRERGQNIAPRRILKLASQTAMLTRLLYLANHLSLLESRFSSQYRPEGILRGPPSPECFYSEKRQIHWYRPFFPHCITCFRKRGGTGTAIRSSFPCTCFLQNIWPKQSHEKDRAFLGGKQVGGFVKGLFWQMYPRSGFWYLGTSACIPRSGFWWWGTSGCTPVPVSWWRGTSAKTTLS